MADPSRKLCSGSSFRDGMESEKGEKEKARESWGEKSGGKRRRNLNRQTQEGKHKPRRNSRINRCRACPRRNAIRIQNPKNSSYKSLTSPREFLQMGDQRGAKIQKSQKQSISQKEKPFNNPSYKPGMSQITTTWKGE